MPYEIFGPQQKAPSLQSHEVFRALRLVNGGSSSMGEFLNFKTM